jgi:hypothetical protein
VIQPSEHASTLPDLGEVDLANQALHMTHVDRVISSCSNDKFSGSVINRVGYGRAE